jgi:nucleotide-binding universal stress UspA family protein
VSPPERRRRIIAGVDGSPRSLDVLAWAAAQSSRTGAQLVAVMSWHLHLPGIDVRAATTDIQTFSRRLLTDTVVDALGAARASECDLRTSSRPPAEALLQAAEEADAVVVGPHGIGGAVDALGSVPERLLNHASCPVAVIHPLPDSHDARIVVGVDGSACARTALRWAIRQAQVTESTIEAVVAWQGAPHHAGYAIGPDETVLRDAARRMLDEEIAHADAPVTVTARVAEGRPAPVLVGAATGASLLVVGSHGAGRPFRPMLGSTSHRCARNSQVPVVVVHCDQ